MKRSVRSRERPLIDRALAEAAEFGFTGQRLATDFRAGITVEVMSRHFTKFHLGRGFALHRFEHVDPGPPHDHPCDFTTLILAPYVEDIYAIHAAGWTCARVTRGTGETHTVAAATIHKIVALPGGESWTLVHYGPHVRTTRFYRFGEVVESRARRERTWKLAAR